MAQLKAAKEALDRAFSAYEYTKSALQHNIAKKDSVSTRAFESKLLKFDAELQEINVCHSQWLSKASLSEEALAEEKYNTMWLKEVWNKHTDLKDLIEDILFERSELSAPPVLDTAQKVLVCTTQMETLQLDIKTTVEQLMSRSSGEIPPSSHKRYGEMLSNVTESINTTFSKLLDELLSLDPTNVNTLLEKHEPFRQQHLSNITKIKIQLADRTPSASSLVAPPTPADPQKVIKMEPSKAPTFSGRTLEYPEFKRGWKKVVSPVWTDANQVEQIKLRVDSNTKHIITRCRTMDEVWLALDGEYAQELEVINAVDQEINKLRSLQCTTAEYIVKLRSHLPYLEDILSEVNGLEQLQSPQRVNFLADKLDDRTLYEWDRFRSKATGSTYERFFNFILEHYDASRSTIARLKSQSIATAQTVSNPCTTCNLGNHNASECPHIQSINTIAVEECHRCNRWVAKEGIYKCPGCGRGTAKDAKIHHCLEHCGAFMEMSPNDRSNCVERAKVCPVHLLNGNVLDDCTKKNDSRYICGIDGCKPS